MLAGFPGSGKAALIGSLLADERFADTAVLMNELGDVPIDHALVRESSERIVVLAGGCICCRVAGDVVRALRELHFQRVEGAIPDYRRVVIETTGLADPAPLLATLVEMPLMAARHALAGVVTTVDAQYGLAQLEEHAEAMKQAAMADRLVVTKCDRVGEEALETLERRLDVVNPGAARLRSCNGNADPALLLDAGLYRGSEEQVDAAGWLNAGVYRHVGMPPARHDDRITSFVWTRPEPCAWEDVESALDTLVELRGSRILRMKGLVNVAGEPGPRAIHAVQHTIYPPARLAAWPDEDRRTRIVFIGRDLDDAEIVQLLESFLPQPRAAASDKSASR